jgi:hypothetical protein
MPGEGTALPLRPTLADFYGPLRFPSPAGRPWVVSNFVASLDGVVSLGTPRTGGSGHQRKPVGRTAW